MKALWTMLLVLGMTPAATTALRADDGPPADNVPASPAPVSVARPCDIKRPQDFAPPEQIVAERDLMEFRRPGTLLSMMSRNIPKVDTSMLADRVAAMYEGERFFRAPMLDGGDPLDPDVDRATTRRASGDEGGALRFGWLGWTILGVVVVGGLAAWRLGWFVPFSQRKKARASQAAAAGPRNREAKSQGPKIELVKWGA